jgi:predicted anti-sigma-YlaC factor YlaD
LLGYEGFSFLGLIVEHPDERRLYEAARNKELLTLEERQHLNECEDCKQLLQTFARQQRTDVNGRSTPKPPRPGG